MPQKTKLKRVVDAYDRLKTDILTSELAPGFQAPEPEIAERLGMSRTPVREALIRLQSDGLIDLVPRRGARILGLNADDLQEVHEVLGGLETEVCSQLAAKGMPLLEIDECNSVLEAIAEAEAAGDLDGWLKADTTLRLMLFEIHGNKRLQEMAQRMLDQLYRGRLALLRYAEQPDMPMAELSNVMAAVYAGDAPRAARLAGAYRRVACEVLVQRLEASGYLEV